MPTVTWAALATSNPMGQQRYESEIQAALRRVAGADWQFEDLRIGSLRTDVPGARRAPTRLYADAPVALARLVGGAVYRTRALVHRFDLRLPPSLGPEVVTAHDLPPLRFDDEGRMPSASLPGARRARVVIVPSEFAASELRELAGVTRVEVIPYGVSDEWARTVAATDAELVALGLSGRFVVHAAGASARKNLPALAGAWREVVAAHPDVTLALCGPPDARRDAAFDGVPNVVMAGRLAAPVVAGLMRRSAAVVVPSLYEGFGLPALEGMVCGAPVVAARAGALPEVVADAGLLTEPDALGVAEGLDRVLSDADLADGLRVAGPLRAATFSWDLAASRHLDVYEEALG